MSSHSIEKQLVRTQDVMEQLNSWNLSAKDQIILLGLPSSTKARHLQCYTQQDVLPQTSEINERIDHLFGIADALRTSYPHNALMGSMWLRTAHRRFKNQAPINVMINESLTGLISVRSHLDCAFDWELDHKNKQ